jgi:hypothetical protein
LLDRLIGAIGAGPAMAVRALVGLSLLGALAALLDRSTLAARGLVAVTVALGAAGAYHLYGLVAHACSSDAAHRVLDRQRERTA